MNILIVTPNQIDTTSYYRAWGVFPQITRAMPDIHLLSDKGRSMTWVDINQMDLVFMHRPYTLDQLNFAMYAKEMGVPLWVDYDDDLTSIPEWMSFYQTYMNEQTQKLIQTFLSVADVVTVSTQALAERFKSVARLLDVIPNALNDDFLLKETPVYSDKKIVMWRGSETHHVDLLNYSDQIKSCLTRDDWEWMYFGYNPWFLPKTKHIPVMDPVMYFKTIRSIAPSVMFTPLVDDTFNRCKSNINWMEATMAGAVALVPGWDTWTVPGAIQYKDQADFAELLKYLMSGESFFVRKQSHEASMQFIRDNLLLSKVNEKRMAIIEMLAR
jgi:hypothetical protein